MINVFILFLREHSFKNTFLFSFTAIVIALVAANGSVQSAITIVMIVVIAQLEQENLQNHQQKLMVRHPRNGTTMKNDIGILIGNVNEIVIVIEIVIETVIAIVIESAALDIKSYFRL